MILLILLIKKLENVRCVKPFGSRVDLEVDHLLAFNPRVDICIKLSQRIGIYIKEDEMLLISKKHRLLFFQYHDKTGYRLCLNLVLNLRKRAARVILDADYQTSPVNLLKKT